MPPVAVLVVAVLVGAVTAVLGSAVHLLTVRVGAGGALPAFPVGVALALTLTATAQVWLGAWSGWRPALAVSGAAWLLVCLALSSPRPEGDLLVAGTARGYTWLVVGSVLPAVVAFLPSTSAWPAVEPGTRL